MKITQVITEATAFTVPGNFHATNLFGAVILDKLYDGNMLLCRTCHIPEELDENIVLFDVYHNNTNYYQYSNDTRENGEPYSCASLLWKEFGMEILKNSVNPEYVWNRIDVTLMQDADKAANDRDYLKNRSSSMSISQMLYDFNFAYNSGETSNELYAKAFEIAQRIFENAIVNAEKEAKALLTVEKAVSEAKDHIMILDRELYDWRDYVVNSELVKTNDIRYIIYPVTVLGFCWNIIPSECTYIQPYTNMRLDAYPENLRAPAHWEKLSCDELQKETGVKTAIHCYNGGFKGVTSTLEDAVEMVKLITKLNS